MMFTTTCCKKSYDESHMMIKDSREREFPNKEEGGTSDLTEHRTSERLWPLVQNSRIVRVSSAFGRKDRHSKVRTVRGLRDRRVRLSASTALQLYDLQDKLGLTQPSKVIDWLINESQHEINKLPPLQFPQTWASSSVMNDSVLTSNNSNYDMAPFPKAACLNSEALSCKPYNQFEPEAQDFPITPAPTLSSFSSYLTIPSNFEAESTFAQLLPWSSSMYANEAQQVEGMREKEEVCKDCGGRYVSNAGNFL